MTPRSPFPQLAHHTAPPSAVRRGWIGIGIKLCSVLWLASASQLWAQETRPGRLSRETRDALISGLLVEFQSLESPQRSVTTRRLAALYVAPAQPPTPFLPAGRFRAVLTGYFKTRLRGEHGFVVKGRGNVRLSFNGREVLRGSLAELSRAPATTTELVKGYNLLRIEYDSPTMGAAQLRVLWTGDDFQQEPLPPTALMFDGRDATYRRGQALRQGRQIVADRNCLKCHSESPAPSPPAAMPELASDAPKLDNAGRRLTSNWIANWITNPSALRNDVSMPSISLSSTSPPSISPPGASSPGEGHGEQGTSPSAAAHLAAYLKTRTQGHPVDSASLQNPELSKAGEVKFEERGCIACHRFTPPEEDDADFDRISLHFAAAKYVDGALIQFLRDTRRDYHWSRMPRFRLSAEEARELAAYIRQQAKGAVKAAPPGNAAQGRKLFGEVGCANCHVMDAPRTRPPDKSLLHADVTKGCLAERVPATVPDFRWTPAQREAVRTFLKGGIASLQRHSPVEFAQRQFRSLRCRACHTRDTEAALLPYVLLDEGNVGKNPDPIPQLTWAGEKLHSNWMENLLGGKLSYRTRPHFRIDMPAFPVRARLLARGISMQHGLAPNQPDAPPHDGELAKMGRAIAAADSGLACNRCHALGKLQPTAPFEARSTDFARAKERLRYEFYLRWMFDPQRIDRSTRMLKFSPDGKKTGLAKYYEGDARKQFVALWHYLMAPQASESNSTPADDDAE